MKGSRHLKANCACLGSVWCYFCTAAFDHPVLIGSQATWAVGQKPSHKEPDFSMFPQNHHEISRNITKIYQDPAGLCWKNICLHLCFRQFQQAAEEAIFSFNWRSVAKSQGIHYFSGIGEDRMGRWALHPVLVSNCPMAERKGLCRKREITGYSLVWFQSGISDTSRSKLKATQSLEASGCCRMLSEYVIYVC